MTHTFAWLLGIDNATAIDSFDLSLAAQWAQDTDPGLDYSTDRDLDYADDAGLDYADDAGPDYPGDQGWDDVVEIRWAAHQDGEAIVPVEEMATTPRRRGLWHPAVDVGDASGGHVFERGAQKDQAHAGHAGWQTQTEVGDRRGVRHRLTRARVETRRHGQIRLDQSRHAHFARAAQQRLIGPHKQVDGLAAHRSARRMQRAVDEFSHAPERNALTLD